MFEIHIEKKVLEQLHFPTDIKSYKIIFVNIFCEFLQVNDMSCNSHCMSYELLTFTNKNIIF